MFPGFFVLETEALRAGKKAITPTEESESRRARITSLLGIEPIITHDDSGSLASTSGRRLVIFVKSALPHLSLLLEAFVPWRG